jgi:hypothetical protein
LILKELENFDIERFKKDYVGSYILDEIKYCKFFIAGNVDKEEAMEICENIISTLKLESKDND